ncbi:Alpha/beta hydrolase family-domain-containing protein [Boeremia exigua]|uniref:Alpha/beta hydrolase family-domain-containing protein n=1 Tax=Boeremia exigua TaxID=749465 RepID=UPI001E8DA8D1|nr:Alpha/beta hydrolase family-domain-containing protein [Boeremia exigua]KAH6629483.1 Alpha/beta hydrolase family-domain-containing protein [Boeremia exigua]
MSKLATLVFVPGAWHRTTCYDKIVPALEARYHIKCRSVSLPSTSGDPNATFKDDLDAARAVIASETTQSRNVVLVAHSYGGMVANSAIKGFTGGPGNAAIDSSVSPGRVIGLVLIASGFTLTGLSFMDPFFHIPPPSWRVNKETGFADIVLTPRQFFYHDIPEDEADDRIAQLTPQSLKALFEGGEHSYAGWRDVPVWYIGTIEDQGLPVAIQRVQVGMARGVGALVKHRELRSSHSPFLSQPDEVVDLLVEAVAEFTGKRMEGSKAEGVRNQVQTPAVTIWSPSSWLKYGLPLAIGHIIGWCLLLFYGARKLWQASVGTKEKSR